MQTYSNLPASRETTNRQKKTHFFNDPLLSVLAVGRKIMMLGIMKFKILLIAKNVNQNNLAQTLA